MGWGGGVVESVLSYVSHKKKTLKKRGGGEGREGGERKKKKKTFSVRPGPGAPTLKMAEQRWKED